MNIQDLQDIAQEMVDKIEANLIFVLYNPEVGMQILPYWEADTNDTRELDERLTRFLIKFADSSGMADAIGCYVIRKEKEES